MNILIVGRGRVGRGLERALRSVDDKAQYGLRPGADDLGRQQLESLGRNHVGQLVAEVLIQLHLVSAAEKKVGLGPTFQSKAAARFIAHR